MFRFILIILLAALTSFMPSSEKKGTQDITRSYNYFIEFNVATGKRGDWRKSYNEFIIKKETVMHSSTTFKTAVYRISGSPKRVANRYTEYNIVIRGEELKMLLWDDTSNGVWFVYESNNFAVEFNNPR